MPYGEFERVVQPTIAEFALGPSLSQPRVEAVIDPVCGASLKGETVVVKSVHQGETYYFCSQSCKMEFDDNPNAYAIK